MAAIMEQTEVEFSDSYEVQRLEEKKAIERQNAQQTNIELTMVLNQVKREVCEIKFELKIE